MRISETKRRLDDFRNGVNAAIKIVEEAERAEIAEAIAASALKRK